jgi:hypothetical protein
MLVLFAVCMIALPAQAAEKVTIGSVEDVVLLPWGVKVPARVDSGAALSSIDVCDIVVEGKYVSFTFADRCGGMKVRRPLVSVKEIRTSEGKDERPVVMMNICLGSRRFKTQVTLNDRSGMEYPFLIGRKTLGGRFLVDVSRRNITAPNCPDLKPVIESGIPLDGSADKKPGTTAP